MVGPLQLRWINRLLCLLIGACAIGTLLVGGHAATAEEIIKFAHRLVHRDPSLFVSSVRINAGRGKNTQTWSVELTVTFLVYG